jgi:hypothetical protein
MDISIERLSKTSEALKERCFKVSAAKELLRSTE